ncbi:uncharacterized protein LOC143031706 [Oratosquilla oratoria]|uniref:uncharacterized protein LOC143031706 n=1 Tax=Oratosquilla oratoria TaxID=337810 RepID=UPI003F76F0D0
MADLLRHSSPPTKPDPAQARWSFLGIQNPKRVVIGMKEIIQHPPVCPSLAPPLNQLYRNSNRTWGKTGNSGPTCGSSVDEQISPGLNTKQQFSPASCLGTSSLQQAASKSSHSLLWLFGHSHVDA